MPAHGSHWVLFHWGLSSQRCSQYSPEHTILPAGCFPTLRDRPATKCMWKDAKEEETSLQLSYIPRPWDYLYTIHAFLQIFFFFNLPLPRSCSEFEAWCWRWIHLWSKYSRWINLHLNKSTGTGWEKIKRKEEVTLLVFRLCFGVCSINSESHPEQDSKIFLAYDSYSIWLLSFFNPQVLLLWWTFKLCFTCMYGSL